MSRVAVIGGGLAGLVAADALSMRAAEVVVFESLDRLGGRAITDDLEGVRVDPGAQLFGSMYGRFLALVREIGLGSSLVEVPGRDALWRDGRAHEVVYGSVPSMVVSGGLPLTTKLRLGARYVPFLTRHSRSLDVHAPELAARAGLDSESIAEWGAREIDSAFVDSLVYPQLGAYYGSTPEETSAGFYHILGRAGLDLKLYAVRGGVGRVVERLAERIADRGGAVRLSTPAERILVSGAGVRVESSTDTESFDAAVLATPVPDTLRITSGLDPRATDWLRAVRYRPTLTLGLVLAERSRERYFGLSFPRGEMRHLAVVAHQENKGLPHEGKAGVIIAFPRPESAPELIDLPSREILDRLLPEIASVYPQVERSVKRARVYRWPSGTPVFYPGYLARVGHARGGGILGPSPVSLAGDYLYGPSVEGAVVSGLRAAERIAGILKDR